MRRLNLILVSFSRFVVRALCDDTGAPSTVLVVLPLWLVFAAGFFWRALEADTSVADSSVYAVQVVTLALILWAAALKLGAGVFVPLAQSVAGAFMRSVNAVGDLWSRTRSYGGGPDRTVGLMDLGGELHRTADPRQPNPLLDDETGDRA